jgi:urease accessory protein
MTLIHAAIPNVESPKKSVVIKADRITLAKRRWRTKAEDGREFGFDLERLLFDGDAVFQDNGQVYVIRQESEAVFDIDLPDSRTAAAELAWNIGNMHLAVEIRDSCLRVAADPAARMLLERLHLSFREISDIFRPILASGAHHHH